MSATTECKKWFMPEDFWLPLCSNRFEPDEGIASCPVCVSPKLLLGPTGCGGCPSGTEFPAQYRIMEDLTQIVDPDATLPSTVTTTTTGSSRTITHTFDSDFRIDIADLVNVQTITRDISGDTPLCSYRGGFEQWRAESVASPWVSFNSSGTTSNPCGMGGVFLPYIADSEVYPRHSYPLSALLYVEPNPVRTAFSQFGGTTSTGYTVEKINPSCAYGLSNGNRFFVTRVQRFVKAILTFGTGTATLTITTVGNGNHSYVETWDVGGYQYAGHIDGQLVGPPVTLRPVGLPSISWTGVIDCENPNLLILSREGTTAGRLTEVPETITLRAT